VSNSSQTAEKIAKLGEGTARKDTEQSQVR